MNDNYFVNFYQLNCLCGTAAPVQTLKSQFLFHLLFTHPLSWEAISLLVPRKVIRLHLPAVGEDDEEEVGGDQPADQVEHQVQGGQAEGCLEHIEKVQDQANAIENQPRPQVGGIFLENKVLKVNLRGRGTV